MPVLGLSQLFLIIRLFQQTPSGSRRRAAPSVSQNFAPMLVEVGNGSGCQQYLAARKGAGVSPEAMSKTGAAGIPQCLQSANPKLCRQPDNQIAAR